MLDGLRSFYSRREDEGSASAFSAAMLLSFLCGVNLVSITTLLDALIHGHVTIVPWLGHHAAVLVAIGIAIAWSHVAFAKRTGVYYRKGPPLSANWSRVFVRYCVVTGLLFCGSLLTAYLTRST